MLRGKRFTGQAREFEYSAEALSRDFQGAVYTGKDVVVDENVVTAMGQAFIEFGVELAALAGVFPSADAKSHDLRWFKNAFDAGASANDFAEIERLRRADMASANIHDINH